jgi:hypothetical protein
MRIGGPAEVDLARSAQFLIDFLFHSCTCS